MLNTMPLMVVPEPYRVLCQHFWLRASGLPNDKQGQNGRGQRTLQCTDGQHPKENAQNKLTAKSIGLTAASSSSETTSYFSWHSSQYGRPYHY